MIQCILTLFINTHVKLVSFYVSNHYAVVSFSVDIYKQIKIILNWEQTDWTLTQNYCYFGLCFTDCFHFLQLANGIDVLLAALGFLDGIFVIDFGTAISKIWECSKMLNYSDVEQLQSTEPLPPFPSPQSQIQGLCTCCSLKVNSVVGKNLDMMVVNGAAPIIGCTCVDWVILSAPSAKHVAASLNSSQTSSDPVLNWHHDAAAAWATQPISCMSNESASSWQGASVLSLMSMKLERVSQDIG